MGSSGGLRVWWSILDPRESARRPLRPLRVSNNAQRRPDSMSSELSFQSLTALARLLHEGQTTSTAIVEACLAQIAAHDERLHAFVEVYRDSALACAQAA